MRTVLLATYVALVVSACTGTGQPPTTDRSVPIQPEATGSNHNSEQQSNAFSISTEAYYQATLHSPSSPGRVISLSLTPKRKAEMTTDYLDKNPTMVDTGEWTTSNAGNLLLNLRRVGDKDSIMLEFKTDGEKLVYIGSEYGTAGLILWVKPIPESK